LGKVAEKQIFIPAAFIVNNYATKFNQLVLNSLNQISEFPIFQNCSVSVIPDFIFGQYFETICYRV